MATYLTGTALSQPHAKKSRAKVLGTNSDLTQSTVVLRHLVNFLAKFSKPQLCCGEGFSVTNTLPRTDSPPD